jgi:hypothetical protein
MNVVDYHNLDFTGLGFILIRRNITHTGIYLNEYNLTLLVSIMCPLVFNRSHST